MTLFSAVGKWAIIIDFKMNQEKIAKTLCVEKEVVESSCKGKCHLKKQLKKASQKENTEIPVALKQKQELVCSSEYSSLNRKQQITSIPEALAVEHTVFYQSLFDKKVFSPPKYTS